MGEHKQTNKIYYIGGGACCGKTSIADILREKHGLLVYKLDDYVDLYTKNLAKRGNRAAQRLLDFSNEQMWMRDPAAMCTEQIQLYADMFGQAMAAVKQLAKRGTVLAEGAGFMPQLMAQQNIAKDRFVCIVPTQQFQTGKYAQRSWVKHYLADTQDPDRAFINWMERDARFADQMERDAKKNGYDVVVVDGIKTIEETAAAVETIFGLQN